MLFQNLEKIKKANIDITFTSSKNFKIQSAIERPKQEASEQFNHWGNKNNQRNKK